MSDEHSYWSACDACGEDGLCCCFADEHTIIRFLGGQSHSVDRTVWFTACRKCWDWDQMKTPSSMDFCTACESTDKHLLWWDGISEKCVECLIEDGNGPADRRRWGCSQTNGDDAFASEDDESEYYSDAHEDYSEHSDQVQEEACVVWQDEDDDTYDHVSIPRVAKCSWCGRDDALVEPDHEQDPEYGGSTYSCAACLNEWLTA